MHQPARLLVAILLVSSAVTAAAADSGVRGRVTDSAGAAISRAFIIVNGAESTRTRGDDHGAYAIALPTGEYTIEVTAPGFETRRERVAIERQKWLIVPVALRPATTADITVVAKSRRATTTASSGVVSLSEDSGTRRASSREIVETVPGIVTTQHSGSGKANQYYVRGMALDHGTDLAIRAGGVPVNMPTHAHGQGYADLSFVIPELVAAIDYRKGPYFSDQGDFGSAGSIDLKYAATAARRQVSVETGEDGWRRLLVISPHAAAGGALLWAFDTTRNDGPWTHPEALSKQNAFIRFSRSTSQRSFLSITGTGYRSAWNATHQVPARAVAAGEISRYSTPDASDGGEARRFSLAAEWNWTEDDRELSVTSYAVDSKLDLFSNFTYFLEDAENGDQFEQVDDRLITGGRAEYSFTQRLGDVVSRSSVGGEIRHDELRDVALYRTTNRARRETLAWNRGDQSSGAIFAQSTAEIRPSFSISGGARVDSYVVDLSSRPHQESITTGNVRIAWSLAPAATLYASHGTGFHSNDGRRLATAPGGMLTRTRGSETGVRVATERYTASSSIFLLDIDSELVFLGDSGTNEPVGATRRRGIEVDASWAATSWLRLSGHFTAAQARFRDEPADLRVPGAIERAGALEASAQLRRTLVSARYRYFGSRPLTEDGAVRSPGSHLVTLVLRRPITDAMELEVYVRNALNASANDVDYFYTSRLRGEPAGGVNDIHSHPVPPRTIQLVLRRTF